MTAMQESLYEQADELLTAFDTVANSNSHLLQAPPAEGTLQKRFGKFVAGPSFKRSLCESDLKRDWENCHEFDDNLQRVPKAGDFHKGEPIEFLEILDKESFAEKLMFLLNSGPCWYGKRYPPHDVTRIVTEFLERFPPDNDEVQQVKPDFLFSHDYLEYQGGPPENSKALSYFDGCGCDHCWTWLSRGELFVLLLNGSS
jgi:hypothetical protein